MHYVLFHCMFIRSRALFSAPQKTEWNEKKRLEQHQHENISEASAQKSSQTTAMLYDFNLGERKFRSLIQSSCLSFQRGIMHDE